MGLTNTLQNWFAFIFQNVKDITNCIIVMTLFYLLESFTIIETWDVFYSLINYNVYFLFVKVFLNRHIDRVLEE